MFQYNQKLQNLLLDILPTKDLVKNIEVVFDEVPAVSDEHDDFVFTTVQHNQEEEEEIEEEEINQMSISFDLPIANNNSIQNDVQEKEEEFTKDEINNLEVVDAKEIKAPVEQEEKEIRFSLEDYLELEDRLDSQKTPIIDNEDEELKIEVIQKQKVVKEIEDENEAKEISPLNLTIAELQKTTKYRRDKMKNFNYKFSKKVNSTIEDFEKQPAYKRSGIELDETESSSTMVKSRVSLDIDENDEIVLRSNNSFLHDNVD